MYLHEAIRLGAMVTPQIRRRLVRSHGTCALGAALYAEGVIQAGANGLETLISMPHYYAELGRRWPWIDTLMVPHPSELGMAGVREIIYHLNDSQGWTRERIADWLEPIEKAYHAKQAAEVPVEVPDPVLVSP